MSFFVRTKAQAKAQEKEDFCKKKQTNKKQKRNNFVIYI